MKNSVFILGAHKSGSSLLRSLLDGHPDLFAIPFEMHFFQFANYWVDYRLRRVKPKNTTLNEIKDAYIRNVTIYNSFSDPLGDANMLGRIDLQMFLETIDRDVETFSELIDLYIDATYSSLTNLKIQPWQRIVEKSVENAEFALDINLMFTGSKFIHILRNPYSNIVSIRHHISKKGFPSLMPIVSSLNNSFYYLYKNKRLIDEYLVIRYEDLLINTKDTMRLVAEFLQIDYLDSLLKPTSLDNVWKGNSSRGIDFLNVSASNLNLWKNEITNFEIYIVNQFFSFILDDFDYSEIHMGHSHLWPEKTEGPISYILNRALKYFLL